MSYFGRNLAVAIMFIFCTTSGYAPSKCSSDDEPYSDMCLKFENKTYNKIYIYTVIYELGNDTYTCINMYGIEPIEKMSTIEVTFKEMAGYDKDLLFEINFFNEMSYNKYGAEKLIKYDIYDKRYFLSREELRKINYRIRYEED